MKKVLLLITVIVLGGLPVSATTTNKPIDIDNATAKRGYGKSFIFVENGIEFSIFPDGQFDFYMPSYGPSIYVSSPGVSISFNSGYNYNPFLQYDEFGAIIQVEHVPVYYDYYGRVSQIGNVFINYNRYGYVSQIGGMYIHYNRYRRYAYYSGYINAFNPYYVYKPWHAYYRVPTYKHCVVFHKPYRQYYKPIRYQYNKPYTNNYRRTTAVANRRGNTISRRSELATKPTRTNHIPRRDAELVKPRRGNQVASKPRISRSEVRPKANSSNGLPRTHAQGTTKPRTSQSVKPRKKSQIHAPRIKSPVVTKPRTQTSRNTSRFKAENKTAYRKPKSAINRTYNKTRKRTVASNHRSKR